MSEVFDLKRWLDVHVLPFLAPAPKLLLHAVLQKRKADALAPELVFVWALSESADEWAPALGRLLGEGGFTFDGSRPTEVVQAVPVQAMAILGGDGAPFIRQSGLTSARLYRKMEDGIDLLLEVGHRFRNGHDAARAVRDLFARFEGCSPFEVIHKFGPLAGPLENES